MKKISYLINGRMEILHPCINIGESLTKEEALKRAYKDIPEGATDIQEIDEIPVGRWGGPKEEKTELVEEVVVVPAPAEKKPEVNLAARFRAIIK